MDAPPLNQKERIAAEAISLRYGATTVLDKVTLRVRCGEIVAVLGRSGSGKTSLLRSLALFAQPQSGSIRLDGQEVLSNGQVVVDPLLLRRRVCMVFQHYSLFPNLTGLENITFAHRRRFQISKPVSEAAARKLASVFGLNDDVLKRYPESFSGGQAQRIALLRALILEPEVLLLDEVTSALDPESIVTVMDAIRKLRATTASRGLSVILVTHLTSFAAELADRMVFMEGGAIVEDCAPRQFSQSAHPGVRAFMTRFSQTI